MRYCPICKAKVGYPYAYCPVCQNELYEKKELKIDAVDEIGEDAAAEVGEDEKTATARIDAADEVDEDAEREAEKQRRYYPEVKTMRKLSFADKLQQFIVLVAIVNCMFYDYVFAINNGKFHWSLLVLIWGVAFELIVRPIFRRVFVAASFVTRIAIIVSIAAIITADYLGFLSDCTHWTLPIIILVTLLANVIFFITGKNGDEVVYALCNVFIGIVPELIMYAIYKEVSVMWNVCLIVCITSLMGLIFFMGAKVNTEVHKRLNI